MRTPFLVTVVLLALTLLTTAAACGPDEKACTAAGCIDSLTLSFVDADGEAIEAFSGELNFDGETVEFECGPETDQGGDGYNCRDNSLWLESAPEQVELTASSDTLQTDETFQPEYETVYPNGEDCPPGCDQADVTVVLE